MTLLIVADVTVVDVIAHDVIVDDVDFTIRQPSVHGHLQYA